MPIISSEELGELDERLRKLYEKLSRRPKATTGDLEVVRHFMAWIIYPEWEQQQGLDLRPIEWSDGLDLYLRQVLSEVARNAATFVRTGRSKHKAALQSACKSMLIIRGVEFGREEEPAEVDAETDARDKYIYQKVCKGARAKQVKALIEQHPKWKALATEEEVRECAVRYAKRHDLPLPPE
jgi:hypothetical protein